MDKRLQIIQRISENSAKKQLQQSIMRKRKLLSDITAKLEMLKMDLDIVKHEYDVRIGRLFLKDNQLDLEIIRYKNIKRFMDEGLTYYEACQHEEDAFYNQILRMQKKSEELEQEKEILENQEEIPSDTQQEIRKLWRSLIFQFHPDLVTDKKEKIEREEIMKKINQAYRNHDFDTLKFFADHMQVENFHELPIMKLENILAEIENMIIYAKRRYRELKKSEWHGWKLKIDTARRKKIDVFAALERSLLDDIVAKVKILNSLKGEIGEQVI